ncbi:MAG: chromosomal replication initiator protein DnaA [Bdellovibrionales bacterium]|nr:chromosomal replication initiator protein DnaA [Bdellovibrionales bacterium]
MVQNHQIWSQIKSTLKAKNSSNKPLQMWFEPTKLVDVVNSEHGTCFEIGVPTELHKYWISQNLLDLIASEISAIYSSPFHIKLVVTENGSKLEEVEEEPAQCSFSTAPSTDPLDQHMPRVNIEPKRHVSTAQREMVNPDYTFSTFVVGRNNEFAHAASYNIAENPGSQNYNPLFICGPTGMGKTHLLNAVGNQILSSSPELRICYCSAEKFLNECISSIRRNEMHKFRMRYREKCDILLMDDIQVLGRGEAVQEEFFHTLNDFFDKGQQVVVASDRMPKDIRGLEDRIRTRLEWGLIADIQMPDIETRVAILKYKAERRNIMISQEVISYIARISKRSIRELEGNLNKVKMFSELQGLKIDLELAKRVLAVHDDTTTITVADIQKLCADHFKVRVTDLKSKSRTKPQVVARQAAMFLIKKNLGKSLVEIGSAFGGRDHTTVINALRRIEDQLTKNSDLRKDIDDIQARIHNITGV